MTGANKVCKVFKVKKVIRVNRVCKVFKAKKEKKALTVQTDFLLRLLFPKILKHLTSS